MSRVGERCDSHEEASKRKRKLSSTTNTTTANNVKCEVKAHTNSPPSSGMPLILNGKDHNQSTDASSSSASPTAPNGSRTCSGGGGGGGGGGGVNQQGHVSVDDRTSRDYYFDSYAHHAIHEEMLKDQVRTKTYQMAILQNSHLFKDKIVLDVGCGTGILSMFSVQAGARHVYGVDYSTIIHQAKAIVDLNGFADRITLIQSKVEEVELPVDRVDIIVSEWMGYFLLYESMLETVLFARDKWLAEGGLILPDKATMYLCAVEDAHVKRERMDFWKNVYGFDMSPLQRVALQEPVVDVVDGKAVVTNSVKVVELDILTCTKDDLSFEVPFELTCHRDDYIHAICSYFECAFTQIHRPIGFSTAPFCHYTHWKQTLLYLQDGITDQSLTVCQGEVITGILSCRPNHNNKRDLDIDLTLQMKGKYSVFDKHMKYKLR